MKKFSSKIGNTLFNYDMLIVSRPMEGPLSVEAFAILSSVGCWEWTDATEQNRLFRTRRRMTVIYPVWPNTRDKIICDQT